MGDPLAEILLHRTGATLIVVEGDALDDAGDLLGRGLRSGIATNRIALLFVAAAALNGADFAVTRANLQSGGQELNPVVRIFGQSSAGLAVNFIGETTGVISISYFFHKTGHHKLERVVSIVNIGSSAGAVSYGLAHR
ncbi:MAG: hypothetical protein WB781_04955 [Candidatus Sulfotelmatobacter sp.]